MLCTTNPFLCICMQICFCWMMTMFKIGDSVTLSPRCLRLYDSFRTLEPVLILSDAIHLWDTIWTKVNKVQNRDHCLIILNRSHISLKVQKKLLFQDPPCHYLGYPDRDLKYWIRADPVAFCKWLVICILANLLIQSSIMLAAIHTICSRMLLHQYNWALWGHPVNRARTTRQAKAIASALQNSTVTFQGQKGENAQTKGGLLLLL